MGFTSFATHILGDIIELTFETQAGDKVDLGQIVGRVEATKAVSDIYCVGHGRFIEVNDKVIANPSLVDDDPHGEGWLYRLTGTPDAKAVDAQGYTKLLDEQIDEMARENDTPSDDGS